METVKEVGRTLRGDSWCVSPGMCRSVPLCCFIWGYRASFRCAGTLGERDDNIGFRMVRVFKTPQVKKGDKGDGK
jgi:hypothetical protein